MPIMALQIPLAPHFYFFSRFTQGVFMKKFLTMLAMCAMISAPLFAQVEINYAKEGADSKYDAIKFFSA